MANFMKLMKPETLLVDCCSELSLSVQVIERIKQEYGISTLDDFAKYTVADIRTWLLSTLDRTSLARARNLLPSSLPASTMNDFLESRPSKTGLLPRTGQKPSTKDVREADKEEQ